jgi:hypothetical protein
MQVDIMLFLLVSSSTTTTSGSWGEILSLESTKVYDKLLLLQSAMLELFVCVRPRPSRNPKRSNKNRLF